MGVNTDALFRASHTVQLSVYQLSCKHAAGAMCIATNPGLKGFEGKAFPKRYPEVPSDYSAEQFVLLLPPGVKAQKKCFMVGGAFSGSRP